MNRRLVCWGFYLSSLFALSNAALPSGDVAMAVGLIERAKFEATVKLLAPAVAASDPDAMMLQGVLHASGAGVPYNRSLAIDLWLQAALAGQADAARLYLASATVDRFARTWWLRHLAAMPEPGIRAPSSFVREQRGGLVVEDSAALKWIQRAAAKGDAIGLYNAYHTAIMRAMFQPSSKGKVRRLLERAAEAGLPEALMELSSEYEQSIPGIDSMAVGFPMDRDKAASLMKQAAEAGDARAQLLWGHWLGSDKRQFKDKVAAVEYYRRSSDQGNPYAAFFLAEAFAQGRGVSKNMEQSDRYLRLAAERGNDSAVKRFASRLFKGDGMSQNQPKAIEMLEHTAVTSIIVDVESLELIAYAYATGAGVDQDNAAALWWCDWAEAKGSQYAVKLKELLKSRQGE